MKRIQECNKIERLWRYRWYLFAPFIFSYKYVKGLKVYKDEIVDDEMVHTDEYDFADAKLIWRLVIGDLQLNRMNWYYTSDEVKESIDNKYGHLREGKTITNVKPPTNTPRPDVGYMGTKPKK